MTWWGDDYYRYRGDLVLVVIIGGIFPLLTTRTSSISNEWFVVESVGSNSITDRISEQEGQDSMWNTNSSQSASEMPALIDWRSLVTSGEDVRGISWKSYDDSWLLILVSLIHFFEHQFAIPSPSQLLIIIWLLERWDPKASWEVNDTHRWNGMRFCLPLGGGSKWGDWRVKKIGRIHDGHSDVTRWRLIGIR